MRHRSVFPWLLGMLWLSADGTAFGAGPDTPPAAERLLAQTRPLVIGHRGLPAAAPENTLPSFRLALLAGADLVELDYYHASDGVPVVLHDGELDRTTDSVKRWKKEKIRVTERPSAELTTLDAGAWYSPPYAGTHLPLLTEALDLIQKDGVTLIERKGGDPAMLIRLLAERNLLNQLVVQSFDWTFLQQYHQQEPRQILGALGPPGSAGGRKLTDDEKVLRPPWVDQVAKLGARIVVWNRQISAEGVDYAHQRGLKVWVYTINEPVLAISLLDQGADGLITDNVAGLWRTLALRNAGTVPAGRIRPRPVE